MGQTQSESINFIGGGPSAAPGGMGAILFHFNPRAQVVVLNSFRPVGQEGGKWGVEEHLTLGQLGLREGHRCGQPSLHH